jgi:membrane protein required for colicin V production
MAVDLAIVVIVVLAAFMGLARGFFRSVCGLGGLFFGLVLAAWNYARVAALLLPVLRFEPLANAVGFLLVAMLVSFLANWAGALLARAVHMVGLGCLDRLLGGFFGAFQGALAVTLVILAAVAFFPGAHWLSDSRLPRRFFGACNLSTHLSPEELAAKIRDGLRTLEQETPRWMHPETGKL